MAEETAANFYQIVRTLRRIGPRYAMLAVYAAQFWSDERLDDSEKAGDVPGRPGEFKRSAASVQ
jgi:hypothetical protein